MDLVDPYSSVWSIESLEWNRDVGSIYWVEKGGLRSRSTGRLHRRLLVHFGVTVVGNLWDADPRCGDLNNRGMSIDLVRCRFRYFAPLCLS